jgi:N-acetylglucosaminyldiphosphoundecaprenol N-acetyl-beta-D-mannosaminyltransferase
LNAVFLGSTSDQPFALREELLTLNPDFQQPPRMELMGVEVHAISERQCVASIAQAWKAGVGGWLHTINLDHLRLIHAGQFFSEGLPEAELRVCDGAPLVWASRLQGTPLPERVAGSDLIRSLTEAAATHGKRVFFLGGNPGTAESAAALLQKEYPGFEIAGILCPDIGFEKDPVESAAICKTLEDSCADLVFFALGSPKGERLILEWRHHLPNAWWASIGISFSFVTGEVKRAPRWMQVTGVEWIHRLFQEPRRLGKRYLVHGVPFAFRLFGHSLRKRWKRPQTTD